MKKIDLPKTPVEIPGHPGLAISATASNLSEFFGWTEEQTKAAAELCSDIHRKYHTIREYHNGNVIVDCLAREDLPIELRVQAAISVCDELTKEQRQMRRLMKSLMKEKSGGGLP